MGRDLMADLARSIRNGGPPPATATDGLRAVTVAEAILQSAASGTRIELSGQE